MKRFGLIILILAVCAGAVWYFYFRAPERAGAVTYRTGEIRRGDLENLISSSGTLSAVSTVKVGSQVSGTLVRVHADFNDDVTTGQILAELDTSMLEASVTEARASLVRARAQLAQAQAELERNRLLYDRGFLSESEFLIFTTDVDVKNSAVEIAKAGLNRAQTNLEYAVITAPIDGIVIHRSVDPGQTIAASFQTPELFVIAEDLSRMQIEVAVDESDIGQVKVGMPVRFDVQAYPDRVFQGVVRQIRLQPETISNVVNYTVIVNADNTDGRLLPGMTATVDFIVDQVSDVYLAPNAAIAFQPDAAFMARLTGGMERPEGSDDMPADGRPGGYSGANERRSGQGPGMFPGRTPGGGNTARIFLIDDAEKISPLVFRPGITDGAFTEIREIIRGPDTIEGSKAIMGIIGNTHGRSMSGSFPMQGSSTGGPPPGARGMRRSGI